METSKISLNLGHKTHKTKDSLQKEKNKGAIIIRQQQWPILKYVYQFIFL
jgi:hypothetical protein